MLHIKKLIYAAALLMVPSLMFAQGEEVLVKVDAEKVEQNITPYLYGSCIEDVNHEIYGGLYDQKIFGESFEEPVPNPLFDHFDVYGGKWSVNGNNIFSLAHGGAKLVSKKAVSEGTVEVDVKFNKPGSGSGNAGLLLCVSRPRVGADSFYGYEISLAGNGKKIVVGKHKNNWSHIVDVPVSCTPTEWNNLKATIGNGEVKVFLNNKDVCVFHLSDSDLLNGSVALRVWNVDTHFGNLKIDGKSLSLAAKTPEQVSMQWDAALKGDAKGNYLLDSNDAYNGSNSQTIEFVSGSGAVGIANASLNRWGIAVRKGQKFEGRFYAKNISCKGKVFVVLESADGKKEYARCRINGLSKSWKRHAFTLTSNTDDDKARMAIYIDAEGAVKIDQVTLMTTGKDRFKGLPYRNDISQAMVKQGLTFLRYGGTMINANEYRFKKMIGDPDKRPPYRGHWYKYSTNGFGIEDFLKFCEAAGFTPSFAINIFETPEDAADMIEYLNGSTKTKWGKIRAKNGHPKPYGVKYIGIGNEEVMYSGDDPATYDQYIERFNILHDAIKSKDPSVKLVITAWWRPESPNSERLFKALDGKADYWDYHPLADALTAGQEVEKELRTMKELFHKWNPNTTMKCAIFEENGWTHNMQRTLGHVTLQNAVRRMGDFMLTSCAANALQPYKQNDNGWDQGQIFFTPSQVWGMPPYYAQQMAAENHLPLLVSSSVEGSKPRLDVTATRSEDGKKMVLHIANIEGKSVKAKFDISGFGKVETAQTITLAAPLKDVNTPENPTKITPVKKNIENTGSLACDIPSYSYTVLVLSKQ
ncbi:MAG: DUF1080 domain-containing protein [Bacteroidales bacterium]|nr:DUF1080 domain-containing protein [Bacteroidales bacterium]